MLSSRGTAEQHEPRRQPRQARGHRRVELILNAAAPEFAERGYARATTNGIAARAGVPIGSLYQFFPSKRALLTALVRHHLAQLDALTAAADPCTPQTLPDYLDAVIDAVLAYCASTPVRAELHVEDACQVGKRRPCSRRRPSCRRMAQP